jgi:O-acetyl-ADP-ribose deacetylase (regulator of RNase III)
MNDEIIIEKKIQLVDLNDEMIEAWKMYFKDLEDVEIYKGDFFDLKTDCVVSPANSFGFMNGSLDLVISEKLGGQVQHKLQRQIIDKYDGELLVGQAELVETEYPDIPFLISAPTMRIPLILSKCVNVYLASKAIFTIFKNDDRINSITISGLGTGVGKVPYQICAKQMRHAYHDFYLGNYEFPESLQEATMQHEVLCEFDSLTDII